MTFRRLGLDLGTNSIGWCLIDLDDEGYENAIFKTGVRIFSDGRDPKSLASLKADRRVFRSARRRRDRFLQRQKHLMKHLVQMGFMPEDEKERQALAFKDPYLIRKKALDEEISPNEMGRALFHINQRRGFKSNRKSADNEAGVVKSSIADLEIKLMEHNARTIGEFLSDRRATKQTVRARRLGAKSSDLYEFYPSRNMLMEEVDKLWSKQAKFNPSLYTDETKDLIKNIIFFQRPLKPQEVGRCSVFPDEYRMPKALPSFQRSRIYQELANLAWIDMQGNGHRITNSLSLRDQLFEQLDKKNKLTFTAMRKILKKEGVVRYTPSFNLESETRDHLIGNLTSVTMSKIMGRLWDDMADNEQDDLILLLLDDGLDDDEVQNILIDKYHLNNDQAEMCLNAKLPTGHGALSKKAVDQLLPIYRNQGLDYYDAIKEAGLSDANLDTTEALLSEFTLYLRP